MPFLLILLIATCIITSALRPYYPVLLKSYPFFPQTAPLRWGRSEVIMERGTRDPASGGMWQTIRGSTCLTLYFPECTYLLPLGQGSRTRHALPFRATLWSVIHGSGLHPSLPGTLAQFTHTFVHWSVYLFITLLQSILSQASSLLQIWDPYKAKHESVHFLLVHEVPGVMCGSASSGDRNVTSTSQAVTENDV